MALDDVIKENDVLDDKNHVIDKKMQDTLYSIFVKLLPVINDGVCLISSDKRVKVRLHHIDMFIIVLSIDIRNILSWKTCAFIEVFNYHNHGYEFEALAKVCYTSDILDYTLELEDILKQAATIKLDKLGASKERLDVFSALLEI
jgi:hypothetical protein